MLSNIPNILTVLRLLSVYPLIIFILEEQFFLALGIFFLAGISDLLDGFLARKFSWQSRFGQIADPVADKTLVVATIISLGSIDLIENWFMFMVLGRDLLIIVGVVLANYLISDYQVAPNYLGKLNTTILLLLVGIILIDAVGFLVTDIAIYWISILFIFTNTLSLIVYFIDPGIKILRRRKVREEVYFKFVYQLFSF